MESSKEDFKKRVVKFVTQTQKGCEKTVCLADHCRKNPGKLA